SGQRCLTQPDGSVRCVCLSGQTLCNGVCRDLSSDQNNCGGCGYMCDSASTCQRGQCLCPVLGQRGCNGKCVDTSTDHNNCGGCGNLCGGPGQSCEQGRCFCGVQICEQGTACEECGLGAPNCSPACCSYGTSNCGSLGCLNTDSDDNHCGSCVNKCAPGSH